MPDRHRRLAGDDERRSARSEAMMGGLRLLEPMCGRRGGSSWQLSPEIQRPATLRHQRHHGGRPEITDHNLRVGAGNGTDD